MLQAGLELIGGRPVVNSVNYEDGDGPDSRFARIMPLVKEHGTAVIALTIDEQGQARTAEDKVPSPRASSTPSSANGGCASRTSSSTASPSPSRPARKRPAATRIETIEAIRQITAKYPGIHTTLGVSNVSFGLNPAARSVLNSVFLHEAVEAGLDSAASSTPPRSCRSLRCRRSSARSRSTSSGTAASTTPTGNVTYDPLASMLDLFAGVDTAALKRPARRRTRGAARWASAWSGASSTARRKGLEADLDLARERAA